MSNNSSSTKLFVAGEPGHKGEIITADSTNSAQELAELPDDTKVWLAANCPLVARGPAPIFNGSSKIKITDKDTFLWRN